MMCSLLLKSAKDKKMGSFMRASEDYYQRIVEFYVARCALCFERTATLVVTVATLVFTLALYVYVPKGFFPVQDTGAILGISEGPASVHLMRWRSGSRRWPK